MKNVIQTSLTTEDRTQIDVLLTQLETLLTGKLSAMTEDERLEYGSINEKYKLLVNKVRDYRNQQQALSSPEVNWEEFESDYQARTFLETRLNRLRSLAYQMESTKILHDYDNFHYSLTDYSYSQYKKGAGESGFTEKVAELKQFFPRSRNAEDTNNS